MNLPSYLFFTNEQSRLKRIFFVLFLTLGFSISHFSGFTQAHVLIRNGTQCTIKAEVFYYQYTPTVSYGFSTFHSIPPNNWDIAPIPQGYGVCQIHVDVNTDGIAEIRAISNAPEFSGSSNDCNADNWATPDNCYNSFDLSVYGVGYPSSVSLGIW